MSGWWARLAWLQQRAGQGDDARASVGQALRRARVPGFGLGALGPRLQQLTASWDAAALARRVQELDRRRGRGGTHP